MIKLKHNHKDSIFCALFSDKENFLSLYNALHGTDLKLDETDIEQIIIPQTMYSTFKNDISMLIDNKIIVLIEHQSTINENMPLRCLEYVTRIYEIILKNENRYKEDVISLPAPEFYVFYNGEEPYPNNKILKLSDSFIKNEYYGETVPLDLEVVVKNIKSSKNPDSELKMMEHCNILKQYTQFIEIVRRNRNSKRALKKAIDEALKNGILQDFLEANTKEIINMLCARYSYKTDLRVKAQEAYERGEKAGLVIGEKNKTIAIAKEMIKKNISVSTISEITALSEEEINKLKINN